jgi:hypothetical protein
MSQWAHWAVVTGWLSFWCWAGCKAFWEAGPTCVRDFTNSFEFSFKLEFEFELLSNSTFTQLNPK